MMAAVVALGLTTGCRRSADSGTPRLISAEGCLTAGDGGLMLTRLTSAGDGGPATVEPPPAGTAVPPQQSTEVFVLNGMENELRPHVGQQIRVSGEAPRQDVAIVQQQEPPAAATGSTGTAPAGSAVGTGGTGVEPKVSTTQKTRFATTELLVRAVTPLDKPCAAPR
jgi:hypothetical protein